MNTQTLILANLLPREIRRFHDAGVTYSGSTPLPGPDEDMESYQYIYTDLAPYIATYADKFLDAVKALGWQHISLSFHDGAWIVRRYRPPQFKLKIVVSQQEG